MKCIILFLNGECQALVFAPLKGLIFITRSITVQPKSLFFNAKLCLCDNGLIVMIEAKTTKKTKWLYFGLARHTFVTSDGYKIIEIVRTLS